MKRVVVPALVAIAASLMVASPSTPTLAQGVGVRAGTPFRFGKDVMDDDRRQYSRFEVFCQRARRGSQTCLVRWKDLKDWPSLGGQCVLSDQDWGELQFRAVQGGLRTGWLLPGGRPARQARPRGGATVRVVRFNLTTSDEGELVFVNELGNIDAEGVVTREEHHVYTRRDIGESVPLRCRTLSF